MPAVVFDQEAMVWVVGFGFGCRFQFDTVSFEVWIIYL